MSPSGFQTTTSQGLAPSLGVEELTNYDMYDVYVSASVYVPQHMFVDQDN